MLTKKCYSDVACEFADYIYEKFLERNYGVNACSAEGTYDHREDYILQLDFLARGYKTVEDLRKANVDLSILDGIKGVGKFFNIYNNSYVTNNYYNTYNNITSAGYVHTQAVASATWTIHNPLEYCPNVTIVDTSNQRISGQINYNSDCTIITVTFNSAIAGKAYLS